jgi:hypothetical protein
MRLLILRAIPKLPKRINEMTPLNTNDDTKVLVDGSALETRSDIVDTVSKYECQLIEEEQQQKDDSSFWSGARVFKMFKNTKHFF